MIYTSNYDNFKDSKFKTCSISGNKGKDAGHEGNYYAALAQKRVFWQVWHDNIGKISEEENTKYYIEQYYDLVLSKLDVVEVFNKLIDTVLLCYENNDIFCHRHIVSAWIELLLNLKVPEVKLIDGKIIEVSKPDYVKDYLEEIMKKKIDMKGYNCLRSVFLYEKAKKFDSQAKLIEIKDDISKHLYNTYKGYASVLRYQAYETETEYNKNKNIKKRIYQK